MVTGRLLSAPTETPSIPTIPRFNNSLPTIEPQQLHHDNTADNNNDTSVTLSFGGVEFCLSPSQIMTSQIPTNSDPFFSISHVGKGMKIQLSNFSGTLSVSQKNKYNMHSNNNNISNGISTPDILPTTTGDNLFLHQVVQNKIEDEKNVVTTDRENGDVVSSPPQRFSQRSHHHSSKHHHHHHASATPSPPKSPDQDPKIKEMVQSMPTLPVPTFNSFVKNQKNITTPKAKKTKKSKQQSLYPSLASNNIPENTNKPVLVVPPSSSSSTKKRVRSSSTPSPNLEKNNVSKSQVSAFDILTGNTTKKNKASPTTTNTNTTTTSSSNKKKQDCTVEPVVHEPSLGQLQSLTQCSQNLLSENSVPIVDDPIDEQKATTTPAKKSPKVRDMVKQSSLSDQDNYSISTREVMELEEMGIGKKNQDSTIEELPTEEEEGEEEEDTVEKTNSSNDATPKPTVQEIYTRTPNIHNPQPRWGHTLTLISNDRLILYGGQSLASGTLSELHVYNLKSRTWSKPINCSGLPRCWHSCTYIPSSQLLISFGGESINPKSGKAVTTDQIMVLDTDIMLWYPPVCSGVKPNARSGHTACLLSSSNTLVIFGGVRKGKWLNTVLSLDTNRWKWSSPKISGDAPRPRSYHSTTAIRGNRLVVFGGNDGQKCFNTVHVLDASMEGEWKWIYPNVSGEGPCARTGHCATLLEDGKSILIHGGWDPNEEEEEETIFDDCFILDTSEWTWSKGPQGKYGGGGPEKGSKRVGYSAALVQGQGILGFGGRSLDAEFGNDFQVFNVEKSEIGLN